MFEKLYKLARKELILIIHYVTRKYFAHRTLRTTQKFIGIILCLSVNSVWNFTVKVRTGTITDIHKLIFHPNK